MTTAVEWHSKAMALFEKGDVQEARTLLVMAINADPQNAQYLLDYAQIYVELGQYEKAQSFFQAALQIEPHSALGNYRWANLFKQFGHINQAIERYSAALAARAGYAEAFNNRGGAYHIIGLLEQAKSDYLKAIEIDPSMETAYFNLGRLLDSGGDFDGAAEIYRRALASGLNDGLFSHLLASVTSQASGKAPLGYVRAIFDDYARAFDVHLTQALGYTLPKMIGTQVKVAVARRHGETLAIDLGCGTGLCGVEIAASVGHLSGVDASASMLDHADRRGIYHDLVEGDIEQYLINVPASSVDFLIAADVFIYIGELSTIFSEAARVLCAEGVFLFSIELLSGARGFKLQRTGRYQHEAEHIQELAGTAGLWIAAAEPLDLRLEQGLPVPGMLFRLAKNEM